MLEVDSSESGVEPEVELLPCGLPSEEPKDGEPDLDEDLGSALDPCSSSPRAAIETVGEDTEDQGEGVRSHRSPKFPLSVYLIIGNEFCERFSYYGLRAVLVLYAKHKLGYSDSVAISIFAYSSALAYMSTLLGGYVSDTCLGKYKTILSFVSLYALGEFVLATTSFISARWGLFLGLIFIGLGTGGIKPCVSAFGADQFGSAMRDHISSFFHTFYFAINVGSVSSLLTVPFIRREVGYPAAFALPFVLLCVSIVFFVAGRRRYKIQPPRGSLLAAVLHVIRDARAEKRRSPSTVHTHWLDFATPLHGETFVHEVKALLKVLPVFAVLPVFWALFDQQGSAWTLQADEMDGSLGPFAIPPDAMQVLNPILILLLLPLFTVFIYPAFRSRGVQCAPLSRIAIGMLFAAASFVVAGLVQLSMDNADGKISIFWQIPQYTLMTIGEILVSVTGLEFAYQEAPASMKSIITSLYLATTSVGDIMTGVLYNTLAFMARSSMFFAFSGLMILNTLLFLHIRRGYTYSVHGVELTRTRGKYAKMREGGGGEEEEEEEEDVGTDEEEVVPLEARKIRLR